VTVVTLVISGVLLLAIICLAAYGWVTLPADARVPLHYGFGSYDSFTSKRLGLVMWPVGGALVFGIIAATAGHAIKPNHPGGSAPLIILPIILVIVAAAEWGAISVARRNARSSLP
jgi:hypothetical protein